MTNTLLIHDALRELLHSRKEELHELGAVEVKKLCDPLAGPFKFSDVQELECPSVDGDNQGWQEVVFGFRILLKSIETSKDSEEWKSYRPTFKGSAKIKVLDAPEQKYEFSDLRFKCVGLIDPNVEEETASQDS